MPMAVTDRGFTSIKLGRSVRFRKADIDAFIERSRRAMKNGVPIQ
jgi:hypothetical protein